MKYEVVALGELLIDFTDHGVSDRGNPVFEANPGGAPGNVLAMLAKLGHKTAMIGKVGDDIFGAILIETLEKIGIGTANVYKTEQAGTTLAFVHNTPGGDREFSFFRKPGADTLLRYDEVGADSIKNCRIFHFGSLSLTAEPARKATQTAVIAAKANRTVISFDPNLRPMLWKDSSDAKLQIEWGCSMCHILKIADDELLFLTGRDDGAGIDILRAKFPEIKLIFLTKGVHGAEGYWGNLHSSRPAFLQIDAIDTTGAGDTFFGCCLSRVLACDIDRPDQAVLDDMLVFACAAAALTTTKKGALLSMPDRDEISALINQ